MSSVRPKLGPATPKVVTAWDVGTGATVYRTANGEWSGQIADADVLTGDDADKALDELKRLIN